jgi:RHS repeat-associated protein
MAVTEYIWDVENDSYLMETDEDGATQAVYSNEPSAFGGLVSQRRDGQTSYYHDDALGSTRDLSDADENVTDEYVYTAWGEPVVASGTTENPFRWVGRLGYYWDAATGTYYIRRRDYQPNTARWLSLDVFRYVRGPNRYAYVDNEPMGYGDPMGRDRIVLERDIPKECPPCPCVGEDHDCFIEVVFLKVGDSRSINYTHSVEGTRQTSTVTISSVSNTRAKRDGGRIFQERFPAIVILKSMSGKDVRNCHLQQDVVDFWKQLHNGTQEVDPLKEGDYGSKTTDPRDLTYGGWWLYDAPHLYYETTRPTEEQISQAYTHMFFQAHVFVEENPKVEIYWGGYAMADYSQDGNDMDAIAKRDHFGPKAERAPNPFLQDKPSDAPAE